MSTRPRPCPRSPSRPGAPDRSTSRAILTSGDFGPLAAKELALVFANPASGIEPIRRPASNHGDGTWRIDGQLLPVAGTGTVRLAILISDFEMGRLTGEVAVRP